MVTSDCMLGAVFQAHVTVPDDTRIEIGQSFVKTWRIANTGTCDWGEGYRFTFAGGDKMGGPDAVDVAETPAGESAEISVHLVAPVEEGRYRGYWQMCVDGAECFGDEIYVRIVAFDPSKPAATAPPAQPTTAPTQGPTATAPPQPTAVPTEPPAQPTEPPGGYIAPGVWRCPGDTSGAAYVGSAQSDKFHYLTCRWAGKIHDENRLCFGSREAAVNYGYVPCGVCKP